MAYRQDSANVGTVTQFDVLVGGASSAIASVGPGSAGQALLSGGNAANPAYSTPTYPSTSGTSGKVLISNGTNNVYSTPTFPNVSATTGKIIISDGTNWIASTPTIPNAIAQGDLLYGSATSVVTALAKNASSTRYLSNTGTSNNPAWAQVALATGVSDYVQGSFTPALAFGGSSTGITYNAGGRTGEYTKIGNIVYFSAYFYLSSKGVQTGDATITGFPIAGNGNLQGVAITYFAGITLTALYTNIFVRYPGSGTVWSINQSGSGQNFTTITDTGFANNSIILAEGFYFIT